jgi:hypothetical protein
VLSCERDESQSYRLDRCEVATGRLVPLAELESRRGFRVDVHPVSGRVLFDRTERLESDLVGIRNF